MMRPVADHPLITLAEHEVRVGELQFLNRSHAPAGSSRSGLC